MPSFLYFSVLKSQIAPQIDDQWPLQVIFHCPLLYMDWEILHEDLVFLSHYISTTIILYIFRHESYRPDGHFVIKLQLQQNVPPISLLAHQA